MTTEEHGETTESRDPNRMIIFVKVETGDTQQHVIEISSSSEQGLGIIESYIKDLIGALEGITKHLCLPNPPVIYNPYHIVFVQLELVGPAQWQQMIEQAIRPFGFKPQAEVKK